MLLSYFHFEGKDINDWNSKQVSMIVIWKYVVLHIKMGSRKITVYDLMISQG